MRLYSFQIKNYRSILDSGEVKLSENDNVSVFAGQNESGKSSLLVALYDYENGEFNPESLPFSLDGTPTQSVSCTYKTDNDDLCQMLTDRLIEEKELQLPEGEVLLDQSKINRISEFTITRYNENGTARIEIDADTFNILRSAIQNKPQIQTPAETEPTATPPVDEDVEPEKYIDISDNENTFVADIFWHITPRILFLDDFCDLLPDKISIKSLKTKDGKAKGYKAVRNLEKILNIDFVTKDNESDPIRRTKEQKDNDSLSIDFQEDWGQRIHGENKVIIKYDFQKRDGEGDKGSYVNFYVETKEGQPLPPKQRSKGLIWFLSLWLELKAQDSVNQDLVLLLDEPDQHLHVRAQGDVLKLINKLAEGDKKTKGDQIIYATHSPYLIEVDKLSRIKLVLNTEKSGTQLEDVSTSKINTQYKRDALQPISDAIGLSVNGFSTIQEKNVLLEGISDFYYFMAMRKLLNRNDGYHFIPGVGVRQTNNLISFCIGYGLDWVAIIDDDPVAGGKDSKKKFDEIKDHMFNGDENKTKEKIHILPSIVGIENMFEKGDLKLVDTNLGKNKDNSKAVGDKRKVLFSKLFFEKVEGNQIQASQISDKAKNNFNTAFDFIDVSFPVANPQEN